MAQRICIIQGCGKPHEARGWCQTHYVRWKATGDAQADVPVRAPVSAGTLCSIDECSRQVFCRTWCSRHYARWRQYGDPLGSKARSRKGIYPPGSKSPHEWITCGTCGERALVRIGGEGYCSRKCSAAARAGASNPLWRGDEASYFTLHRRVYQARGKADHCERCGASDPGKIYQWANLTGNYADVWDYEQMCIGCHAAYDAPAKPRGAEIACAKLTEDTVREARRRQATGESATSMATEFGVSAAALVRAIKGQTWKHVPMEFAYRPSRPGPKPGSHHRTRRATSG